MKTLTKILISVAAGFALTASAQVFQSPTFINPNYTGLYISNAATYLTNLSSAVISVTTNMNPVTATNQAGVAVQTNNIWNVNLLRTVPIVPDRNGQINTNMSIFVKIPSATAGANATNGFLLIFAPCPDGTNDSSQAADFLQVSNGVGNTAVSGNWYFPFVPKPGVRAYMLQKVGAVAAPTAANSQFVIGQITLQEAVP